MVLSPASHMVLAAAAVVVVEVVVGAIIQALSAVVEVSIMVPVEVVASMSVGMVLVLKISLVSGNVVSPLLVGTSVATSEADDSTLLVQPPFVGLLSTVVAVVVAGFAPAE